MDDLVLDSVEVKDVAYYSKEKILKMIDAQEFWNFLIYLPTYDYFGVLEKSL
ncbi:MAG: hypothetical protein JEZ05_05605 [Tenericutes bacterium]|nr:hypothetical protein [Mycoplasmatota bacterium]